MASSINLKTELPLLNVFVISKNSSMEAAVLTLGLLAIGIIIFCFNYMSKTNRFPVISAEYINKVSKEGTIPRHFAMIQFFRNMSEKFDKPFTVKFQDRGTTVVLPPKYNEDIRNNKDMDLNAATAKDFFPSYPGFDGFKLGLNNHSSQVFGDAVRIKLTQALTFFTDDLSVETNMALAEAFPISDEWQRTQLFPTVLNLVTRLSSIIFVGHGFEHMRAWQDISASYTVNAFQAARTLRLWHPLLRPIVHWFLPETTKLRAQVKHARSIIEPEVKSRRQKRREAIKNGATFKKSLDSVDWFEECKAGEDFDFVAGELALSMVAIHTTTSTLMNAVLDICSTPELIQPLRNEITAVIQEDNGLVRTTLHKLKLLDSVLKESQRLHPLSTATLQRGCLADVKLHDGIVLPKGTITMTPLTTNFDPAIFPDPFTFDGYRFLNLRQQPGNENKWQFTTTQTTLLGFGHGVHACPGRFFASNEIKIALMHMIMKYDWKFVDGETRPESIEMGLELPVNPFSQLMYKARIPEVRL